MVVLQRLALALALAGAAKRYEIMNSIDLALED